MNEASERLEDVDFSGGFDNAPSAELLNDSNEIAIDNNWHRNEFLAENNGDEQQAANGQVALASLGQAASSPVFSDAFRFQLLPNCLALVFKQNSCSIHFVSSNQLPSASHLVCRTCCSRLIGVCPHCHAKSLANGPNQVHTFLMQQQSACTCPTTPAIEHDLGYQLFLSFRDINKKYLFWHRDLARCLRRLEYVGFLHPFTILVSTAGGDEWLDVLKRCWSQQLLVSPPCYSLELMGDVQGSTMQAVCQSAAVNLIDAICGVLCDLAQTTLPSTLDVIYVAITHKYSTCGAEIPPVAVFQDLLAFLVEKRRVIVTLDGSYCMAPKEMFTRHNRDGHNCRRTPSKSRRQRSHAGVTFHPDCQCRSAGNRQVFAKFDQPVSLLRRLFKRRFFGRVKGRASSPPLALNQGALQTPSVLKGNVAHLASFTSAPQRSQSFKTRKETNLLPYRGAGLHLTPRPSNFDSPKSFHSHQKSTNSQIPGLLNCYNTGAVPSVSCSSNTLDQSYSHMRRSRNPYHHYKPSERKQRSNRRLQDPKEHEDGIDAPFPTPTSIYHHAQSDPGQIVGDGEDSKEVDFNQRSIQVDDGNSANMASSSSSSSSSSSWTSTSADGMKVDDEAEEDVDGIEEAQRVVDDSLAQLNATCAQIVNEELDNLIEKYRQVKVTAGDEAVEGKSESTRASTATLFSVGDYIVYSAGLMVETEGDNQHLEGNDNSVRVSAENQEESADVLISMVPSDDLAPFCDESNNLVETMANVAIAGEDDQQIFEEDAAVGSSKMPSKQHLLKLDAGQAIFGA